MNEYKELRYQRKIYDLETYLGISLIMNVVFITALIYIFV